jgi:hypothetical protein
VRRLIRLLGALVVVAALASSRAADAPAASPLAQTTIVRGTPPEDLEGRWLLLSSLGTAEARRRSTASLWEVARRDGALVVTERFVRPAGAERAGWEPLPEELRELAEGWDEVPPEPRGVAQIRHEIIARDAFDDAIRSEPIAADARWIVRQQLTFEPGGGRPAREIRLFAARTSDAAGHRGAYVAAMIVAAPMPIPIKVDGTFRLHRLPEPALWTRLLDVFRGCNR